MTDTRDRKRGAKWKNKSKYFYDVQMKGNDSGWVESTKKDVI